MLLYCGLAILVLLGIAAMIKGVFVDTGNSRLPVGESQVINDRLTESRGTEDNGEYIEYTYPIEETAGTSLMLCLDSFWSSFRVLLDGEEIYAVEDTYKELGVRKQWIQLPKEAGGKLLTIRFYSDGELAKQTVKVPIYLGEKSALIYRFLLREDYALIFFCFALILGVIVLAWEVILNRKISATRFRGFRYLGLFILDAGIWVLTDSKILQLFTGKTGVWVFLSFLSFVLLPCFMLLFLREIITHGKRILEILCTADLVIAGLMMFVYLFRLLPMYCLLSVIHLLILVTMFVTVHKLRIEVKTYHNAEAKGVLQGLKCLAVFVLLSLYSFWRNPAGGYAIFYCIGIFLFVACLAYAYFNIVYRQVEENARNLVYKQMAYMDSMTGLGNRAAFEKELKAGKASDRLICIICDNNNLKRINDTYGHQEGDVVITETAKCLSGVFGGIGRCFRIGGDEFAVLLKNVSEDEVEKKLTELKSVIREKSRECGLPIELACGYELGLGRNVNVSELFSEADKNMYENKKKMKTEQK